MAETFKLAAQSRENTKNSARDTRNESRVPGVVYGKEFDPVSISLDASDILRTFRTAGKASLIDLDMDGKNIKVLIQDLSLHPVMNTIHHVDFFAVNLKERTIVQVPLNFIGESPAVKNFGGVFTVDHDSIEIRCLPTEIPHDIEIDIAKLENLHDHICIKDLTLPENFELMHADPETPLCSVAAPRLAEETENVSESAEGEEGAEDKTGEDKEESSE
ncbi:MAG: 50S ribosomal protein L25 [Candidatus Peregrinibacteria bacterium]|nr:50S ribosomal protein L25 [Candidatus Peregrinibacteria bacterium]